MRLGPLFSVIVLDLIGFGIVMPILPFYAETYGANATVLGLLLAIYALMQFLCAPLWGRLSDRIGRKPVLLMTIVGGGASLVVLGLAQSLAMIFLGRMLSGICAANVSVASAYVSDVTTDRDRASGMGLIGVAFGVGFFLGPALGGLLSPHGYALPILVAAGLNGLNALYTWWCLPEPSRHRAQVDVAEEKRVLAHPAVRRLVWINFLFTGGISQLEAVFAFLMMDRFHYDAHQVAYLFVYSALIMMVIQGGVIRRLKGVADRSMVIVGSLLLAVSLMGFAGAMTLPMILLLMAGSAVGRGLAQPFILSLVSKSCGPGQTGAAMGAAQAAASLARVFAPALAGVLYDWQHAVPFLAAGALILLVVCYALPLKRAVASVAAPVCQDLVISSR